MSCLAPKIAWRRSFPNKNGKYPLVFNPSFRGDAAESLEVPCGKCMGCKADQAHQWAIRIYQEASLYDRNSFVTLTYDDENLPKDGKISKESCSVSGSGYVILASSDISPVGNMAKEPSGRIITRSSSGRIFVYPIRSGLTRRCIQRPCYRTHGA